MGKDNDKKPANVRTLTWGGLNWVDVVQPTKENNRYLTEQFNFHPLDLEDALSLRQLSKIEEYPQYLFVIFHLPVYDKKTRVSTRKQWSAFIGDNFIVTLRPKELTSVDDLFHECELAEDMRKEYMSQGSGYLLYRILDRALDAYFPTLDKILSQVDGIENVVFSEDVDAVHELSILRRDIIAQRRVMFPTRATLVEMEKKLKRFSKVDLTIFFSDLMDHMNKICETLDESSEIIEVFKDADYLQSSYRANLGIRVVVVMLSVLIPLLVVFGLGAFFLFFYGGTLKDNPLSFVVLAVVTLIITGITLLMLRRRHLV
ncbi:MAG: magnesium transporter CorA family protein [Dehalococcoidales bacterium]|nr:magnesium transporter CorA family protein [Dehalococcoidales bacterium]